MRYPLFYRKLSDNQRDLLAENSDFYLQLNRKNKKLFEHRITRFIEEHRFIEKAEMEIDERVKVCIANTAIKLSFGYENYLYDLFDTIIVYPEDYFSVITNERHQGETNPQLGVIVFSWDDFKAGVAVEDDNLQLGLHEFTHALYFSFKYRKTNEALRFLRRFNKILKYIEDSTVQKNLIETNYIRNYAFTNQYELLAVLVEHYFETPNKFRRAHPNVYKMLESLLQFDKKYNQ